MIKAPYNFVPLAQKIVFPEWAETVSIDRPFQDGVSGTIDVTYTAQTPLFVGNGKEGNNGSTANYMSANGKYAIPGSSLRGMFRNVIEIVSFGKFNRVSDVALSVRDLHNRKLYSSRFTDELRNKEYKARSKAGWLVFDNVSKVWVLYPVQYHRIETLDLREFYGLNGSERSDFERGTLSEKRIRAIRNKSKTVYFSANGDEPHPHHCDLRLVYSKVELKNLKRNEFNGSKCGYIVLTGKVGRKHLDFIFEDMGSTKMVVDDAIIRQFKQANTPKAADQKKGLDLTRKLREYTDFGYPAIPVFYLPNRKGEIESLGLSQMYRLPYKHTLIDAIKNTSENNFSDKMDLAECIFGKISNEKNMSLRGRVQFEDAVAVTATLGEQVKTILGNPKPTYYPNYIEQDAGKSEYKTLMDNDVRLRGWKRYPVKDNVNPLKDENEQGNVASRFTPLQKGSVFKGKIHFHNLKKEELGALLWAVTCGGDTKLSHGVGMGKPYGYGQIKAELSSLSYLTNDSRTNEYKVSSSDERDAWVTTFVNYMEEKISGWENTPQLRELKAMANPKNAERRTWDLSHMSLKDEQRQNQFVQAKGKSSSDPKYFLAPYSKENQDARLKQNGQGSWRNNGSWRNDRPK